MCVDDTHTHTHTHTLIIIIIRGQRDLEFQAWPSKGAPQTRFVSSSSYGMHPVR